MPTYDYRCKDCGHEFEIHQSFSEDALTECPECKGNLRKVFGSVGISFKGSGFYKTDSRSGGSSKSSSSAGSSSSSSGDSSSNNSTSSASSSSPSDSSGSSSGTSGSDTSKSAATTAGSTSA